jgi:hypothetical protein
MRSPAMIAMVARATYGDIGRAIHVHPTLAEGVNAAAAGCTDQHVEPSDEISTEESTWKTTSRHRNP